MGFTRQPAGFRSDDFSSLSQSSKGLRDARYGGTDALFEDLSQNIKKDVDSSFMVYVI